MNGLAQVGVLYVYIMLVILMIGFGYVALRLVDFLANWVDKSKDVKEATTNGTVDKPWIRLAFVSATMLFLSIFTLGVLKTLGTGEGGHHGNTASNQPSAAPVYFGINQSPTYMGEPNLDYLQSQANYLSQQLYQMERGAGISFP